MAKSATSKIGLLKYLDLSRAANYEGAKWELFQLRLLSNTARFGVDVKARQIAWSFTAALDAVLDGIIHPDTPHIFVSINLDEAREKIRYAKSIIEALVPYDESGMRIRPGSPSATG